MKGAATQLLRRQSKNHAFFSKLSNFYFDLRPPGQTLGETPVKTEERKPDPWGN